MTLVEELRAHVKRCAIWWTMPSREVLADALAKAADRIEAFERAAWAADGHSGGGLKRPTDFELQERRDDTHCVQGHRREG